MDESWHEFCGQDLCHSQDLQVVIVRFINNIEHIIQAISLIQQHWARRPGESAWNRLTGQADKVSIRTRPEGRVNQRATSPLMYNAFSVILREPDRQSAKAVTKSATEYQLSHGISALSTRETSPSARYLPVRALISCYQRSIKANRMEASILLDAQTDRLGQAVKAKAVFLFIDFSEQATLKFFHLHLIDTAFENRLLHPLPHAFANLRDTSQTLAAGSSFGRNIVGDNDQHAYLTTKGR